MQAPSAWKAGAATAAGRAGFSRAARCAARAMPWFAAVELRDTDLLLAAMRCLFEGQLHVIPQIIAPLRLGGVVLAAAEKVPENTAAAEDLTKYLERIVEACPPAEATSGTAI